VRQISARLDGIPLAIELAAARADVLSVEDIAARLDDRFRLLTGGSRTALPRQQTLRSAIDWSYDLLSAPERIVFRRLAVFAGGWTLEAAEAVCAGEGIESVDVLGLLGRLVDQSLVIAVTSTGGIAGLTLTRYHFLETLRQYAFERLADADEAAQAHDRHLAYYIRLGEAVATRWYSAIPGDQASQARRLELDFDNVRSALDWTAECGRVDDGIRLIETLYTTLFFVRPLDQELLRQLQRLTAHPAAQRSVHVAWAYMIIGTIYFDQDQLEQAEAANEQARVIGLDLGDASILSQTSFRSALLAQERGDFALARAIFDRLVAAGENMLIDWHMHYGVLALYEQDYPQAHEALARLYASRHAGAPDKVATSGSARMLGYALTYQGDFAAAASKLRESLVDNWEMRDERAVAACLGAFGVLAVAQADLARAARLFGASEALIEAIHDALQYFDRVHVRRNVAALRTRLDEATLSAEWAVGCGMTVEQAIEYALQAGAVLHSC
jgi:non-specific serine/threonine protein kinase